MTHLVSGLARGWVTVYTAGLNAADRDRRRTEIDSDIWEHCASAVGAVARLRTGIELFLRVVLGMAADVLWRYEHDCLMASQRHAMDRRRTMMQKYSDRGLTVLGLLMAGLFIVPGTLVLLHVNGDLSTGERLLFGPLFIAAGIVMLTGLYVSGRSPWLGAVLVSAAAIGMALFMFWLFFILVPLAIVLISLALMRARRLTGDMSASA